MSDIFKPNRFISLRIFRADRPDLFTTVKKKFLVVFISDSHEKIGSGAITHLKQFCSEQQCWDWLIEWFLLVWANKLKSSTAESWKWKKSQIQIKPIQFWRSIAKNMDFVHIRIHKSREWCEMQSMKLHQNMRYQLKLNWTAKTKPKSTAPTKKKIKSTRKCFHRHQKRKPFCCRRWEWYSYQYRFVLQFDYVNLFCLIVNSTDDFMQTKAKKKVLFRMHFSFVFVKEAKWKCRRNRKNRMWCEWNHHMIIKKQSKSVRSANNTDCKTWWEFGWINETKIWIEEKKAVGSSLWSCKMRNNSHR